MQNYVTATESAKSSMKIITTITEKKFIEKEIELPYFCKYTDYYYKVATEKEVVVADYSTGYSSVKRMGFWLAEENIIKAEPITEQEFNQAFETALNNVKALVL
jgi:hypothetical protein